MLVRVVLLASVALFVAPAALACSCLCTTTSASVNWGADATYVFRGEVLSVESHGDPLEDGFENIRMKVTKLMKGEPKAIITLRGPAGGVSACGVGFRKGGIENVIAFREEDGYLWTSQCAQYCATGAGVFKSLENGQ
jgi:hypothetical protein